MKKRPFRIFFILLAPVAISVSASNAGGTESVRPIKTVPDAVLYASFEAARACFALSRFYEGVVEAKRRGVSIEQINSNVSDEFRSENKLLISAAYGDQRPGPTGAEAYFEQCLAQKKVDVKKLIGP